MDGLDCSENILLTHLICGGLQTWSKSLYSGTPSLFNTEIAYFRRRISSMFNWQIGLPCNEPSNIWNAGHCMKKKTDLKEDLQGYNSSSWFSQQALLITSFQAIFSLQYQLSPLLVWFGRTQSQPNKLVEGSVALD